MQNYLNTLIGAVIVCSVAELFVPDGEGARRPLGLIVSLLMLCVIVAPLTDALAQGSAGLLEELDGWRDSLAAASNDADDYAARTMVYICTASEEAAAREITALLGERFGLPAERCRVEVALADDGAGNITLGGVKVYLSGSAVLADAAGIEAYLAALFGGRAIVVIE